MNGSQPHFEIYSPESMFNFDSFPELEGHNDACLTQLDNIMDLERNSPLPISDVDIETDGNNDINVDILDSTSGNAVKRKLSTEELDGVRRSKQIAAAEHCVTTHDLQSRNPTKAGRKRKTKPRSNDKNVTTVPPSSLLSTQTPVELHELDVPLFKHTTDRALIPGAQTTFWNHDFLASYELTPNVYHQYNLTSLNSALEATKIQAEKDGRLSNGQPTGITPSNHPVREFSLAQWNKMPVGPCQFIHKHNVVVLRQCDSEVYNSHDPDDVEILLGSLDERRTLHDASLQAIEDDDDDDKDRYENENKDDAEEEEEETMSANAVHTYGTLQDVIEVVKKGEKIVNVLDISLARSICPAPFGLASQEEAEMKAKAKTGTSGRTFGLFGTRHALHLVHIDVKGQATKCAPRTGVKFWMVGIPEDPMSMASIDAFGEGSGQDFSNNINLRVYGVLLRPGDCIIMGPGVPHMVYTLEPSICHGCHFYCAQSLTQINLALVQSFIAATYLTNTTQFNAIQGLQQMMAYLHGITRPGNDRMYLMELKKAKKTEEPDGSHVIPHKFNFHILEDVIGFCNLFNILMLGSIIDERRYREQVEADLWDDDHHIPEDELHFYANARERAIQVRQWVLVHFELRLDGAEDTFTAETRLQALSDQFLWQQCRALVLHKFIAQSQGIQAEDRCITPERIRRAIETDFPEAMESDHLWPKNLSLATLKDWLDAWKVDTQGSYGWRPPPEGGRYYMKST
ncbi:hypothetical protein EV368DRAFT_84742 [Lentinula lateritia]|nr:hypothetical protein EV368DRAFT_84742 [Lentinula lateritia]